MTDARGWARPLAAGAPPLRRGAWYPVLEEAAGTLIVEVGGRRVSVLRELVERRPERPERWSIVVRSPTDPNIVRGTPRDLGPVYAVCPVCALRMPLTNEPGDMLCPPCQRRYPVEWDETC